LGVRFAAVLFDLVIYNLLYENNTGVAFHAGAVAWGDKVILLPGPSGSGKSTITAWMTAHGFSYLTDELIFLPVGAADTAMPFTRPVCIKSGSAVEIKKYLLEGFYSNVLAGRDGIIVPHQMLNPDFSRITAAPDLILFPVYRTSFPLQIERITSARACTMLMECDVNGRNLGDHGFRQIADLARSIPACRVVYGSFAGFENGLARLFAELHWN
jgi:hypothetical protein